MWLPNGPMEKGTTYMVLPRMLPENKMLNFLFISTGFIQLLVGPASCFEVLQMKVRSSTRATSRGSDRARKLLGRLGRGIKVPEATICPQRRSYSAWEPSQT